MTPILNRRRLLLGAGALAAAPGALAQPSAQDYAEELQVRVENKSVPELCAEKDNIEIDFISSRIRGLQVQAVHPSYINTIVSDRWAPDWSSCDLSPDPKAFSQARRRTFWESPEFWLTGYTFPSFWRPNDVPVRVGDRVERGFHLVQVWMWYRERAEEILVFYPPDGYWRARPLPFEDMRWTAYGSSFLVGPVETQERPIVDLQEIVVEPETRSFTLKFQRGGEARISIKDHQPGTPRARRLLLRKPAGRASFRGAALHVRHGNDERRGDRRLALQARQRLGGGARHRLPRGQRHGSLARAPSAVAT